MEGPPFVNHSKFREDFGVAPVIGVSGVATTGRIWAESQKIPLVIGDLAISRGLMLEGCCMALGHLMTTAHEARHEDLPITGHSIMDNLQIANC